MQTTTVDELIPELQAMIIERLNLEGMTPESLNPDEPLFNEGLGLDSIDAIELSVMLEKNFGIKITNPKQAREIFQSIRITAEYISKNRTK